MNTEALIQRLRSIMPLGPLTEEIHRAAADRLEELERDLVRLRRVTTRPEPSRLEIAARLMAANLSRETEQWETVEEAIWAVEQADALIAAAKEAK